MINFNGFGRKWSWPNWGAILETLWGEIRKTTKTSLRIPGAPDRNFSLALWKANLEFYFCKTLLVCILNCKYCKPHVEVFAFPRRYPAYGGSCLPFRHNLHRLTSSKGSWSLESPRLHVISYHCTWHVKNYPFNVMKLLKDVHCKYFKFVAKWIRDYVLDLGTNLKSLITKVITLTTSCMSDMRKFQSSCSSSFSRTSLRLPFGQYSVRQRITVVSMHAPTKRTVFSWVTSRTCSTNSRNQCSSRTRSIQTHARTHTHTQTFIYLFIFFIQGIYKKNGVVVTPTGHQLWRLHSTTGRCSPTFSQECTSASQSCSSTVLDRTCCNRRQPPSLLATPFAGSNTMRFLSLGVR